MKTSGTEIFSGNIVRTSRKRSHDRPESVRDPNGLRSYAGSLVVVATPPTMTEYVGTSSYYKGVADAIKHRQPKNTDYSFSYHPDNKDSVKRFSTTGNMIIRELKKSEKPELAEPIEKTGMLVAISPRDVYNLGFDQLRLSDAIKHTFAGRSENRNLSMTHIALVGSKVLTSLLLDPNSVDGGHSFMLSESHPSSELAWHKIY